MCTRLIEYFSLTALSRRCLRSVETHHYKGRMRGADTTHAMRVSQSLFVCTVSPLSQSVGVPTVDSVLDGFNAAIIAYGQTGSGTRKKEKENKQAGDETVKENHENTHFSLTSPFFNVFSSRSPSLSPSLLCSVVCLV